MFVSQIGYGNGFRRVVWRLSSVWIGVVAGALISVHAAAAAATWQLQSTPNPAGARGPRTSRPWA
jgi:hypothetical protein